MTAIITVGYRTRHVPGVEKLMPDFKGDQTLGKKWLAEARTSLYTCTFDSVVFCDGSQDGILEFNYRDQDSGRPSVSVAIRNYLVGRFPTGWTNEKSPPFRVLGFNPKFFLTLLSTECSMPGGKPLPLRMWYGASPVDVLPLLHPEGIYPSLSLRSIVRLRCPTSEESKAKWEAAFQGWHEPHVSPRADTALAIEIAAQFGFILGGQE